MQSIMTNKEIRKAIENGNVQFKIAGVTTYGTDANGYFGEIPKILEVCSKGESIWEANTHTFIGMNIDRIAPTTLRVYGFDLLGNHTKSIIRYSDITILN